MRIAVAVGIAALCLVGFIVLLRRGPDAVTAPPAPPPATSAPSVPAETVVPRTGSAKEPEAAPAADPRRLLAELARALRQGDPNEIRALLNTLQVFLQPPVTDDQNAALVYLKAFERASETMGGLSMKGLDNKTYSAAVSGKELTAGQRILLREWFDRNRVAVAEVTGLFREAALLPQCRFPAGDSAEEQKRATRLQYASNFLNLCAMMQQQTGRTADAADTAWTGLALGRAARSMPDLVAQLIGCAMDAQAAEGLQRTLDPRSPTLSGWLDGMDPVTLRASYQRALLGDVARTVGTVLEWRGQPATDEDREWANGPLALQDLGAYVEAIGEFHRVSGRPYHDIRGEMDALVRQHGEFAPGYASISQSLVPSLPSLTRAIAKSEARLSMAKLALEIERYRSRNGGYPATLDALGGVPPRDPFTGQPFGYRKEGAGFVLESPGDGGKDAGTWRSRN